MKDSSEGMIEFLGTSKENNIFSALISFTINEEKLNLRFQISEMDFVLLRSILNFRPFDKLNTNPYKYFFTFSYRKEEVNIEMAIAHIRVEQNKKHKQFEFKLSRKLISNLLWFNSLNSKEEVKALII